MRRSMIGIVTAAAAVALFGGAAQAGDPKNQDGPPGRPGTGTATCRWLPPTEDHFILQCTATGGQGGAGGASTDY
ncbi:hypothetical protein GCM10009559_32260 [Pseudonocardia zijingensis]|uniref:Uncharacterized protein n=1 Tax=Pseudonocardia zijingensis TaxID=153376 RepID=A0ABN1Q7P5_9PSEU